MYKDASLSNIQTKIGMGAQRSRRTEFYHPKNSALQNNSALDKNVLQTETKVRKPVTYIQFDVFNIFRNFFK